MATESSSSEEEEMEEEARVTENAYEQGFDIVEKFEHEIMMYLALRLLEFLG